MDNEFNTNFKKLNDNVDEISDKYEVSIDTVQTIKTQLSNNKWKLKRQKVEGLKSVINSEIY